jgi:hypothetical protein
MGREKGPIDGGLRWPRLLAHLAIVIVFVLTALGYMPFHERAAGVATAASDATGAAPAAPRECSATVDVHRVEGSKRGAEEPGPHASACDGTKAELAFARKLHASGTSSTDLPRSLGARPAQ